MSTITKFSVPTSFLSKYYFTITFFLFHPLCVLKTLFKYQLMSRRYIFSSARATLYRMDYMLEHKTNLNKNKKIEIISIIAVIIMI